MNPVQKLSDKAFKVILAMFVAFLNIACDPAIRYSPRDWTKSDEHRFSKTVGLIDIQITDVGGIIGNDHLIPEVTVHNRAKSSAVIESATLKANGSEYVALPLGEAGWQIILPSETRKITLDWELGKPLYDVLKDPVEIHLIIRVGNERTELNIPMVKTFG